MTTDRSQAKRQKMIEIEECVVVVLMMMLLLVVVVVA